MSVSPPSGNAPNTTARDLYHQKCARNIGWVTWAEQDLLRTKRVAIAGLGGVGGAHLLTLTRLGIGRFTLADPDTFEPANFNRQVGANEATLGRPKVQVLAEMARAIHGDLHIDASFDRGINSGNVERFLAGADVYLDGLDFFALQARREVFAACHRLGIPAVTAAPLGMGVALLNFLPKTSGDGASGGGGMSFEEYFRLEGQPEEEQLFRFLVGLAPQALNRPYLVDPTTVNLKEHYGPSTPMACDLCAGFAGTQVLKILLGRGEVVAAPEGLQFDAYVNQCVRTCWRPWDHLDPRQPLRPAM